MSITLVLLRPAALMAAGNSEALCIRCIEIAVRGSSSGAIGVTGRKAGTEVKPAIPLSVASRALCASPSRLLSIFLGHLATLLAYTFSSHARRIAGLNVNALFLCLAWVVRNKLKQAMLRWCPGHVRLLSGRSPRLPERASYRVRAGLINQPADDDDADDHAQNYADYSNHHSGAFLLTYP